ncbi:anthrone oxygenase family protein [Lutibacter flavus]|uniref:Uncharacterized membrane protein n=1 Tax=Lutibacter flavus TaxID=691689 RepID=A0A238ZMN4_9FLAO|nr:DUF1772 domain-containing protein [Lutibacter flavus]SNR83933.1 Uncharacterized membrane protein [Lutibacter flavus]
MEVTIQNLLLTTLIALTGLSAGLCFTWSNAITPGIGRLDNIGFLQAFQKMNRAIINPLFLIVFFGPFLLNLINLCFFKGATNIMWLLIAATAVYFFGVLLITIFGNVPLNEILDKTDLGAASIEELKQLRDKFEDKWNRLHLIRTVASTISFLLLIITALIKN